MKNTQTFNGQFGVLDDNDNLLAISDGKKYLDASEIENNSELKASVFKIQNNVPFTISNDFAVNLSNATVRSKFVKQKNIDISTQETAANINAAGKNKQSGFAVSKDVYTEPTEDRNFGSLAYPIDADYSNKGQDYLLIEQFEYKPPRQALFSSSFSDVLTGGVTTGSPIKEKPRGTVRLPIPSGISDTNSVNWNGSAMGPAAGAGIAAATKVADAVASAAGEALNSNGVMEGMSAFTGSLLNSTVKGSEQVKSALQSPVLGDVLKRQLIASALQAVNINVSAEELLASSSGRITNQNLELLFSSMNLRQFNFAFEMVPRSHEEAIMVRKIIRFFKQGSSPKKSALGSGNSSFYIKTPNVFRMAYKKGNDYIKGLNKFKICACQGVSVNYAPNGYSSYLLDSQPVTVSLALGFTELTPIFYDDYEDAPDHLKLPSFDVDDVGF